MLDKQNVQIALSAGINTKDDPKQVQGKLLVLQNGIFQTGMEIRKRNGYIALPSLGAGVMLSPYNNELVVLDGNQLYSYNASGNDNLSKGTLVTTTLLTSNIVRNANVQTNQDSAYLTGVGCFVWIDSSGGARYSVIDSITGQTIVNNALMDSSAVVVKVLGLGTNFVIFFYESGNLKYKTVSTATPQTISSATTIATDVNATAATFDAEVFNSLIYIAYPSTTSHDVSMFTLSPSLVLSSKVTIAATIDATCLTVFGDASNNAWVAYGNASAIRAFVVNSALSPVLASTLVETVANVRNVTGIVSGSTATIYYECVQGSFTTVELTPNSIRSNTLTISGTAGTAAQFLLGFGLGAKVFSRNSVNYLFITCNSTLQSTYFLVNGSGTTVLKLSQGNGGGYTSASILPEINLITSGVYQIASLLKDNLVSVNGNLFTGTGVISAQMTFSSVAPSKFILGSALNICGGIVKSYDGANITEQNFNLFPEGLAVSIQSSGGGIGIGTSLSTINNKQYSAIFQWTDNQGQQQQSAPSIPVTAALGAPPLQSNGTFTRTSTSITNVANAGQMSIGQFIAVPGVWDGGGSSSNTITAISGSTVTMSNGFPAGAGAPATGPYNFLVSSYAIAMIDTPSAGPSATAGSNVITTDIGVISTQNVAVGQMLLWAGSYQTPFDPAASPFPPGTYITAVVPAGSSTAGTITVSQVALNSIAAGAPAIYLSFDTQSIQVKVPYLHLTDKQNVTVNIYATEVNETVFYQATSPSSPQINLPGSNSLAFTDNIADNVLIGNEQLYTTGGQVENTAPPALSFATTFKSRPIGIPSESPLEWWFGQQTIPGVPVQFSDVFTENVDSKIGGITAVGAMDDKIIFFGNGPTPIFYVVGTGPSPNGSNNDFSDATPVASDVGCQNQSSVVLTPVGLMFQSPKGIYLLDRSLEVSYIGADVEGFNSISVTSSQLMDDVNQVRFTLANGTELVFDYYYKQWDVFTDLNANDSGLFQTNHTIINPSGAVWQESPGTFTDNGAAILLSLTSNWMSFDNIQGYQRIYSLLFLGEWKSAHTLTFNIYTDFDDSSPLQTTVVPMLTDPSPADYQFRVFMNDLVAKCQSIKIQITESQPAGQFGEGLSISNLAFIVGTKQGLNKVTAAQSFG